MNSLRGESCSLTSTLAYRVVDLKVPNGDEDDDVGDDDDGDYDEDNGEEKETQLAQRHKHENFRTIFA